MVHGQGGTGTLKQIVFLDGFLPLYFISHYEVGNMYIRLWSKIENEIDHAWLPFLLEVKRWSVQVSAAGPTCA